MRISERITILLVLIGSLLLVMICAYWGIIVYERSSYERYTGEELFYESGNETFVTYQGEKIDISGIPNDDLVTHLKYRKRKVYLRDAAFPKTVMSIEMPDTVTFRIFPNDDDSVILEVTPAQGWSRKYILYGDTFGDYCQLLYEMTANAVFNGEIEI